jgi:hypothetical protein
MLNFLAALFVKMGLVGNLFFGLKAALAVAFVAVWAIVSVAPPLTLMPPTDSSMKVLTHWLPSHPPASSSPADFSRR